MRRGGIPILRHRHRADLLAGVALFALPFIVPGCFVFSQPGLLGADPPTYHLPHQQFIYDHLRTGVIPFWNPYAFGGIPEFGNPEWAPMYPPVLPALLLAGPVRMLKIKYLFHLGLLGLGCFLFCRLLRIPLWLAAAGGLTLQFSGFHVTKIGLPNQGDSATWLPLMLFLNLWFARRPSLRRGLIYSLAGGCMLLLYFPQVTMPLFLVLVITGAGHFWGWSGALGPEQGGRGIRWVDRAVLPVLEGAVLLAILRYPDGGGRSGAATGLGADGAAALALAVVFWVVWLAGRGQRPIVRRRELVHWAVRFAAVWAAASLLAAPQLLPTAELIAHSSLSGQVFSEGGFFTGVQAYGSVQNFLDLSALAKPKESVNNMALGPAVYLLVFAGVLGGFHRRRRLFLIFWLGALAVGAVYFDLPIAGPLVQRLPFFNKFPGLSRYLAFLNFFLVMLALLSARLWLARLKGKARRAALTAIILGLAANLLLLARHETRYFTYLKEKTRPYSIPAAVDEMLRANIAADERVILDPTTHEAYFQAMMYGARAQLPVLPGYGPLRLASYDRWLAAHNRSLGRDTDFFLGDYRAKVFEPRPSPWSRALRVRGFLFPPGENARRDAALAKGELAALAQAENWVLLADPQMLPAAWPERDLHRDPPVPEVPAGWQVRRVKENPNRAFYRVVNPGDAVWLVVPDPNYPGWCAWVDDKPAELATAYGFLQAVRVPGGTSCVRLEFRPQSFILGWLCFLWAVWGWAALFVMALARAFGLGRSPGPLSCALLAAGGLALVAGIGSLGLWSTPDSFIQRVVEAVATAQIAVLAGYFAVRYAPRRTGKRQGHPDGAFPKAGRAAIP